MSDEGAGEFVSWSRATIFSSFVLLLVGTTSTIAGAETVTLEPSKDNTLYEDEAGSLSNGSGRHLFAGRVFSRAGGFARRALIAFDVGTALPAGAMITSAELRLTMSRSIVDAEDVSLHRVLADWGEGDSQASSEEGGGGPAADGDATWIHTFFDSGGEGAKWTSAGGDFEPASSATTPVGFAGIYTWGSTAAMVADVQAWLDQPQANFGWILIGNETFYPTAKRFDSRENEDAAVRPHLVIEYEPPGATQTATETSTGLSTETPTPTETATETQASTPTDTSTPSVTPTPTETETPTSSATATDSPTPTATETNTATATETETATPTPTATQTDTATPTVSTHTATATPTEPPPTATPTVTATFTPTASPTQAARRCVGDCDADGMVLLAEVVSGVEIALGRASLSECPGLDVDDDERVEVGELVRAVDSAFACAPACPLPNPAGCKRSGCPEGFVCDLTVGCEPSACACNDDNGDWVCTEDCGGGTCVSENE
jgi:hypothetical protein